MPEFKRNFTAGKMNKDLNERLVPKGEYRDAVNIEVSTSEGSDVGTVQNILGNKILTQYPSNFISNSAKTLGSVADEKNDKLYYLVWDVDNTGAETSYILASDGVNVNPVFVDKNGVLGFASNTLITGINIIDDMLFWTDNETEPKKINIPRSIQGTYPPATQHTRLINADQGINFGSNVLIEEEHITVVKKAPIKAPELDMVAGRPGGSYTDLDPFSFTGLNSGDTVVLNAVSTINHQAGDVLLIAFNDSLVDLSPITTGYDIRVVVENVNVNEITCSILSINDGIPPGIQNYSCDLDKSYEKLYKLKFPRFAIRYKYQDGQYSSFGPFSEAAFIPGPWDESTEKVSYLPNTGYNLGMENKLRELTLKNIVPADIPKDVKQIDIIYKESDSPAVYVVDEIKPNDTYWASNSYLIQQENIKSILPSNQLLRPYDNVPKTALAQEISGNRIVYGNYSQNYSLGDLRANFNLSIRERERVSKKSIKSIRDYQVGVVYTDKYNRQTPVLTDTTGALSVSKYESSKSTQIEVTPNHAPPSWATHHKFYIKETSNEYYNLSLDRHFNAEDGNIWLSFASNDRNKIDLENTLYLKKKYNSNDPDTFLEKYKVIDIKAEAPEFIKTRRSLIGRVYNNTGHPLSLSSSSLFTTYLTSGNLPTSIEQGGMPVVGQKIVRIQENTLANTTLANFHKRQNSPSEEEEGGGPLANNTLFMRMGFSSNLEIDQPYRTEWYEIDNVIKVGDWYLIRLKDKIGEDATWLQQPGTSGFNASHLVSTAPNGVAGSLFMEIAQDVVQNRALFQGRFFVKILKDEYIDQSLGSDQAYDNAQVIATAKCGYLKDFTQEDIIGNSGVWGHTKAGYAAEIDSFNTGPWTGQYASSYGNGTTDLLPPTAIPTDSYWGHSVWQRISNQLDARGSRWVIDEAFAVGEEPLWGSQTSTNNETEFFNMPINQANMGGVNETGRSKTYGGHNALSANPTTAEHNQDPTSHTISSLNNIATVRGLGHGTNTTNWEHYSVGKGVQEYTIDISYIGPGRKAIGNVADVYADTTPSSNQIAANNWQYTAAEADWPRFYKITNGSSSSNTGVGDDTIARDAQKFVDNLIPGALIRFKNDPNSIIYKLTRVKTFYKSNYAESKGSTEYPFADFGNINNWLPLNQNFNQLLSYVGFNYRAYYNTAYFNRRITYRLTLECIVSPGAPIGTDGGTNIGYDPIANVAVASTVNTCPIEILALDYFGDEDVPFPKNPAIFETEPKDSVDLNIFHEATDTIPLAFSENDFAPIGSIAKNANGNIMTVIQWGTGANADRVYFDTLHNFTPSDYGSFIRFLRPDGSYTSLKLVSVASFTILKMDISSVENNPVGLGWNNCYSFGNGVESNRIRDTFNSPIIDKGPKVSATLDTVYEEELRQYGLIYSGIYNSTSGINNLNQFIQAEKITKDINPVYGSIQKLYSGWGQGGDLIALCEDRVLKILANKDALFNADGNTNVTSTNRVLGQAIPYSGEYGISTNPESFASEAYRAYFSDKVRGTVMRLSMDGLTPISNYGMKDWFRDNLKLSNRIIGSYDDRKDEYNITLEGDNNITDRDRPGYPTTVTFKESVKGWVSFKSFVPENAISCANEYYTFKNGEIWKHHSDLVPRNTFYGGESSNSLLEVVINDMPGSVKSFKTVDYEGSQAKVTSKDENGVTLVDSEYFNLSAEKGWYVSSFSSNLEDGLVSGFVEKEGKWFGHTIGNDISINPDGVITNNYDTSDFSVQGIGGFTSTEINITTGCMCDGVVNDCYGDGSAAFNYSPAASTPCNTNAPNDCCIQIKYGCTDPDASNLDPLANTDDGSCIYLGCIDEYGPNGILNSNFDPNANTSDGSCIEYVPGCTDVSMFNYSATATIACGGDVPIPGDPIGQVNNYCCEVVVEGCIDPNAAAITGNTNNNTCEYPGCTDPTASNYSFFGTTVDGTTGIQSDLAYQYGFAVDDGSCLLGPTPTTFGCTDASADNYSASANTDDGSCLYCSSVTPPIPMPNAAIPASFINDHFEAVITHETTAGNNDGIIQVTIPPTSPFGSDCALVLHDSGGSGYSVGIVGNVYTFTGLHPDVYSVTITQGASTYVGNQLSPCVQVFSGLLQVNAGAGIVLGCTDGNGTFNNYTMSDGSAGTHAACNYNPLATIGNPDAGDCEYSDCVGCMDTFAMNHDPTATIADNGTCSYSGVNVSGCTDAAANNYDPNATTDDGSCTY